MVHAQTNCVAIDVHIRILYFPKWAALNMSYRSCQSACEANISCLAKRLPRRHDVVRLIGFCHSHSWWCHLHDNMMLLTVFPNYRPHPPSYLPTHLPTYLPTYVPAHLPTYPPKPPTYLPVTSQLTCPSTDIPTYQPTYLPTYLNTHLCTYRPTTFFCSYYLRAYCLPTRLRIDLSFHVTTYPITTFPSQNTGFAATHALTYRIGEVITYPAHPRCLPTWQPTLLDTQCLNNWMLRCASTQPVPTRMVPSMRTEAMTQGYDSMKWYTWLTWHHFFWIHKCFTLKCLFSSCWLAKTCFMQNDALSCFMFGNWCHVPKCMGQTREGRLKFPWSTAKKKSFTVSKHHNNQFQGKFYPHGLSRISYDLFVWNIWDQKRMHKI